MVGEDRTAGRMMRLDRRVAVGRACWGLWAGQNLGAHPWVGG